MTVHPKPEAVEALLGWMFGEQWLRHTTHFGDVGAHAWWCGADPFSNAQR